MFSLVNTPRYLLVAALALIGLSVSAADRPYISVVSVRTADDIIRRMPQAGLYGLGIRFAGDVDPAARTAILNEALASERARDIVDLDLSFNQLTQPPVLIGFVNLRWLDLYNNQLTQPPVLTGLVNLQVLNLSANHLTQPPVLTGLVNLRELDLRVNQLAQPPVLTGLVNLHHLRLNNNQLTQPPVLTGLFNLQDLHLRVNQLMQPVMIPQQLVGILNLGEIEAEYNIEGQATNLVDIATPLTERRQSSRRARDPRCPMM